MDQQQPLPGKSATTSRVLRSHQEARISYNRKSAWYDFFAGSERKYTRLALDMLAVQPGERMLDLGCGTGSALGALAKVTVRHAKLIGCDLSTGMLARARTKLKQAGDYPAVNLIAADAANLPIHSDTFVAILMSFTLELFDTHEIPLILAECRRILKPGGRMVVISMAKTTDPGWVERTYEWLHEYYERFADCRPIFLAECVSESGFMIVRSSRMVMWGLPIDILLCRNDPSET